MSNACDLFVGGAVGVCSRIRDAIRSQLSDKGCTLDSLADNAQILDKYGQDKLPPRHVLMAMLWELDLRLDKILPVSTLNAEDRAYWQGEMKERFLTVAADSGEAPQYGEDTLSLFLGLEVLDEVCAPSEADIKKSDKLHRQLHDRLHAAGIKL